ncbi:MAG: diguanylate cyclase [Desulfovibrionales bacterium]|nr:diguanylate cyclase [Desulfovibrionales bacterium]
MVSGETRHFFLVTADQGLQDTLRALWPSEQVIWTCFERGASALEYLFSDPPDLLVVDATLPDLSGPELIRLIKSENVYRQLPVVLCLAHEEALAGYDLSMLEIDDFLVRPISAANAKGRLTLAYHRATRELDASPLTKLPGNTSIIHKIQDLIDRKRDFALAYIDLDHFKSFNDKYGFSRGDEVLLMTARVIVNSIRGFMGANTFVGHVGGDDFVFIVPPDKAEQACQQVIDNFDSIVPYFYDEEDRVQGAIHSIDRKGRDQVFPLMAISIAVVFNINGQLHHFGEASQIAMNLKKEAKKNPKSCYVLDKRNHS